MAKPRFQMIDDTSTLYLGFTRIWWREKKDALLDKLEPYTREEKLNQKASHYDDYKNRKARWKD